MWDVNILKTAEQQAQGVSLFSSPLRVDFLIFFPWVNSPGIISMEGVTEPLRVYLFDAVMDLQTVLEAQPGVSTPFRENIKHVVETSAGAPPLSEKDAKDLRDYLDACSFRRF